jgi:hypothetical protein
MNCMAPELSINSSRKGEKRKERKSESGSWIPFFSPVPDIGFGLLGTGPDLLLFHNSPDLQLHKHEANTKRDVGPT